MKYYSMERGTFPDKVISGLNGTFVKNREEFFDNDKNGPNKFYDKDYEFDYLVPEPFGDDGSFPEGESPVLADMQPWLGMHTPWGGLTVPISARFKDCLTKFNLGVSKFYKARVLSEGVFYPYYVWQMLINSYETYIDFEKTTFNNYNSVRTRTKTPFEVRQFNSIKQVKEYASKNWGYWNFEKLVLKPSFKEFDYYKFPYLNHVVSEPLKNEIEKQGLTGIQFHELPIPLYFSDEV